MVEEMEDPQFGYIADVKEYCPHIDTATTDLDVQSLSAYKRIYIYIYINIYKYSGGDEMRRVQ